MHRVPSTRERFMLTGKKRVGCSFEKVPHKPIEEELSENEIQRI